MVTSEREQIGVVRMMCADVSGVLNQILPLRVWWMFLGEAAGRMVQVRSGVDRHAELTSRTREMHSLREAEEVG